VDAGHDGLLVEAGTDSQSAAISFENDTIVASSALDAYLISRRCAGWSRASGSRSPVELGQDRGRTRVVGADDDPIRLRKSSTAVLAQELGFMQRPNSPMRIPEVAATAFRRRAPSYPARPCSSP
jgi:hypothetical protein